MDIFSLILSSVAMVLGMVLWLACDRYPEKYYLGPGLFMLGFATSFQSLANLQPNAVNPADLATFVGMFGGVGVLLILCACVLASWDLRRT